MAPRKPPEDESDVEQTTLIFPKKTAWEECRDAKAQAKKRSSSANGTFSKVLARLIEEEHMDRRAAKIVLQIDAIEDDADLHITVHHVLDGLKKLGVMKRAMAQEELFDEHKVPDADAGAPANGKKTSGRKKADAKADTGPGNVTQIGTAARKVAESAGHPIEFKEGA
jgi:hypothetical protein